MELEITWGRAVRIWWAYLWRNLVWMVVSFFVGILVGSVIGAILGAFGTSNEVIQMIVAPISGAIGLALSIVPLKAILGKDFGDFRLVLMAKSPLAEQKDEWKSGDSRCPMCGATCRSDAVDCADCGERLGSTR